jgi:hypothetical protein
MLEVREIKEKILVLEKERQDWVFLLEKSRKKMNLLEFISPHFSSFYLKQIMVAWVFLSGFW